MKRLSISWSKKPTKGVFIEQLKAILNAYHIALSENIKPSELYLSVSPLAHSMLHELCTVQSSFMPSIEDSIDNLQSWQDEVESLLEKADEQEKE